MPKIRVKILSEREELEIIIRSAQIEIEDIRTDNTITEEERENLLFVFNRQLEKFQRQLSELQ